MEGSLAVDSNYSFGADGSQNATVSQSKVATYICPSESQGQGPVWNTSWTNYAANIGGAPPISGWSGAIVPMAKSSNGSMADSMYALYNSNATTIGMQSLTDGTSNTASFSEKLVGISTSTPPTQGGPNAKRFHFAISATESMDTGGSAGALAFVATCKSLTGLDTTDTPFGIYTSAVWAGSHGCTLRFNSYDHFMPPNSASCYSSAGGNPVGDAMDALTAMSNHSGGVNVGFCDGSVRFVKDSVSLQAWWALGTRSGGEVVSSDAY